MMRNGFCTLLLVSLLCGCLSCGKKAPGGEFRLPSERLAEGDVVFLRGMGLMSRVVVATGDGGGTYSHVGILKRMDSAWCVVHAVPDEPEFDGDVDRVKVEPLTSFFAPNRAVRGAVMRLADDSLAARRAAAEALRVAERGTLFDHRYDLADTTRMYCTELVDYAYRKAGVSLSEGRVSRLDVPVFGGTYLLPDDLAANRRLTVVYQFTR